MDTPLPLVVPSIATILAEPSYRRERPQTLLICATPLLSDPSLCRVLLRKQWGALAMLALGVGLVQVSGSNEEGKQDDGENDGQNPLLGLVAVLMACCTSGFAGVYFEKVSDGKGSSSEWFGGGWGTRVQSCSRRSGCSLTLQGGTTFVRSVPRLTMMRRSNACGVTWQQTWYTTWERFSLDFSWPRTYGQGLQLASPDSPVS